jgi:uncharacterized protein Yka (UPF0111/DUF47 family)
MTKDAFYREKTWQMVIDEIKELKTRGIEEVRILKEENNSFKKEISERIKTIEDKVDIIEGKMDKILWWTAGAVGTITFIYYLFKDWFFEIIKKFFNKL